MPPEPFFNGAGLDRADALRGDEAALAALAERDDARELKWADGLPQLTEDGRLAWQPVTNPQLFLGLDCGSPRFSAIREAEAAPWAAFPSLAILTDEDAPLFAAALSLARWHSRHRFCANCGHSTDSVRAGWSRRCPSCSAEHFPRVDPVVIMLAEFTVSCCSAVSPIIRPTVFRRSPASSRSARASRTPFAANSTKKRESGSATCATSPASHGPSRRR